MNFEITAVVVGSLDTCIILSGAIGHCTVISLGLHTVGYCHCWALVTVVNHRHLCALVERIRNLSPPDLFDRMFYVKETGSIEPIDSMFVQINKYEEVDTLDLRLHPDQK